MAAGDRALDELTQVDEFSDGRLYRAEWIDDLSEYHEVLVRTEATVRRAVGEQGDWWFEILFSDAEGAAAFQRAAHERGVPFELEKLSELTELEESARYGLTPPQRRMLVSAYEDGYFEEPRRVTQAELAEKHGLSPKAVSGRLRRGLARLVSDTVIQDG